jgi:hypothetical protein
MSRCKANPCCSDPYNCTVPLPQDRTGLMHLNDRPAKEIVAADLPPLSSLRAAAKLRSEEQKSTLAMTAVPEVTDEMVERALDAMEVALRAPLPENGETYQEVAMRAALTAALKEA